jgi:hypothetical protein
MPRGDEKVKVRTLNPVGMRHPKSPLVSLRVGHPSPSMWATVVVHKGQCGVGVDFAFVGSSVTLKVTARSVAWNLIARCP